MIKPNEIPIELCKKRLRYDDGKLFWIDGQRKGKEAGSLMHDGYKIVTFNGKGCPAHRIIYSLFNGKIADGLVIDHINQIKDDNRIENLRAVSQSENMKNTRLSPNKAKLAAELKYTNVKQTKPTFKKPETLKINIKKLREQFDYKDGFLLRKTGRNVGKPIIGSNGVYTAIHFNDKKHKAHRLIYTWHNGAIGKDLLIDHIDGNKKNNKIENLRAVTNSENNQNSKKRSNNKSGTSGVHFSKRENKWRSCITINGKTKQLGYYADINEAIKARKEAEIKYNFLVRAA